uniref:Growth arrest-specific protein 8 domain-containing protein n=1 Tax=Chromera velia CCMP2878 TaxID=1169474 RepID=A0A0G4F4S0_9ALVE|eukprot:Cvel_15074.t1-p1 / transcript=Cvel_15074.t1 / gene=Cvel_15074 / organism=Chromera_velia_CCMP2878 / gene_product=Growth arrest-specific protein 8 homolog, putative / transcript_product=Growth arrest-specific protein 8 homolog, putative / location=Cvel_scaffold1099:12285-18071(-) / protein_length=459 / sequence_SO=supercontig / SO=protein_coding / is_pseudo=false
MAPKKAGKKKGGDPEAEAREAEGLRLLMAAKQEATFLKAQCEAEERSFNELLQEREKLNYFWIIEKKGKDDRMADLRAKEREQQDLDEKHQIELKVFKQRLKHLRYHETDAQISQQIDVETALQQLEEEHRERESDLQRDSRALTEELKETQESHDRTLRMMRLTQDKQVFALRNEFEAKAKDLQAKYKQHLQNMRDDMDEQRKRELARIEDVKNQHVAEVMLHNSIDFAAIKHYYLDRTSSNLDLIKRLKEDHEELKRGEAKDAKTMLDLQAKHRDLNEPLRRARMEVESLNAELKLYGLDKKKLEAVKESLKGQESLLGNLLLQKEVTEQQLQRATKERNDLYGKFQEVLYKVQQRTGLKNLILEKKLDTLEEAMEVADTQISEILISANLDKATAGGISEKLDQVIHYKNDIIQALHEEAHKIKEAHRQMSRAYQAKMSEFGVPVENVGFEVQLMS